MLELQKDFINALFAYEKAVEISPDEAAFVKAKDEMLQKLGGLGWEEEDAAADGKRTIKIDLPPSTASFKQDELGAGEMPCYEAWRRLKRRTNNLTDMTNAFPQTVDPSAGKDIKSEWWMAQGMQYWYSAMMRQLGDLAEMSDKRVRDKGMQLRALKMQVNAGSMSQNEMAIRRQQLLGLPPTTGTEFSDFLNGITHLGGDHIPAEMGGGEYLASSSTASCNTTVHIVCGT